MALEIDSRCRELFDELRRDGFSEQFHAPSPEAEGTISAWTSAHHALSLRHIDAAVARAELLAVYHACQRDDGLVARERREGGLDELGVELDSDGRSRFIDPPVAAYAVARMILDGQLDSDELLEAATRQFDAIWAERLPPDTSIPVILHPIESATPHSSLFEGVVESRTGPEWYAEIANVARSAIGVDLQPARALRAGHAFVVEDPVFAGWLLIALEDLGRAHEEAGDSATSLKFRVRSNMIKDAIQERLWWPNEEIFGAFDRARGEPLRGVTAGGLVPAASTGILEEGGGKRAVERHLRPSAAPLWGAHGLSIEPQPRDQEEVDLRTGRAVTPIAQFWAHLALSRAGRNADARVARGQLENLVEGHGFHERYDPRSGAPSGRRGFSLGTLLLEMRASDERR